MKDYIEQSRWDNLPIKNPTQSRYIRFHKTPSSGLISPYTKAIEKYNKITRTWNKTRYSELMEE